ncbi:MAG: recombinase family protein [Candidatus Zixiibacteriota bacterium]
MKCAIYARYSSDNQKETSIEDQIRECKSYIDRQGWVLSEEHIYTDYALSGADTSRPSYMALKQMANQLKFDAIVVDDLSRLGRDAGESITVYKEFEILNVGIVSASEGIDTSTKSGKLPLYFKGIMNEMFLDDLKTKVRRGLKGQVERGYSAGGRVYGYKYVPEYDPSGAKDKFGRPKRIGVRIEINEAQSEVIREIFDLARRGYGQRYIADYLNREGICSPRAKTKNRSGLWSKSSIFTILNQRKYIGDWTWNKSRMIKFPDRKNRVRIANPEVDWVKHQCENLRIVCQDDWSAVHHKPGYNGLRKMSPARNKSSYLLSGLLRCSKCGRSMIVNNSGKYSAYMCSGYKNGGISVCDNTKRILRSKLEAVVIDGIRQPFTNPVLLNAAYWKFIKKIKEGQSRNRLCQNELINQRVDLENQIDNIVSFIQSGDTSKAVRAKLSALEDKLSLIEAELDSIKSGSKLPKVSISEFSNDAIALIDGLGEKSDSTVRINHVLKQIIPEPMSVSYSELSDKVLYKVNGELRPFRLPLPDFPNVWQRYWAAPQLAVGKIT